MPVRIVILGTGCPVIEGVTVGPQRGRDVVDALPADGTDKRWELEAQLVGATDLRGPYVHGRPGGRFLYLSWQAEGLMFRRAKLMLDIAVPLFSVAGVLATVGLSMPDGSPVCAAVRPPAVSWSGLLSPGL